MRTAALTRDEIISDLNQALEVEFSFYDTAKPAEPLVSMPYRDQLFVLDRVRRAASINIALGYEFLLRAGEALARLDREMIESWLLKAMDSYDKHGLGPALDIIKDMEAFIEDGRERQSAAFFEDYEGILTRFVHGLSGRELRLEKTDSAIPFTDSETLYLPSSIAQMPDPGDNFRLYKCMVAHLWAQTRFGTFRVELNDLLSEFPDRQLALGCFHTMERIRLDACIRRELPGLYRDMQRLSDNLDEEQESIPDYARFFLQEPDATVQTTVELLHELHDEITPSTRCYQGCLDPVAVAGVRAARIQRERALVRLALREMAEDESRTGEAGEGDGSRIRIHAREDMAHDLSFTIEVDGNRRVAPPEHIATLLTSVMLDFGEIPEAYLTPASDDEYDISRYRQQEPGTADVLSDAAPEEGAFFYREWDHRRKHYKKDWCVLRELEIEGEDDAFYRQTREKYRGLILSLRRTFELLRGEDKLLKRQPNGDDIDLDALVDAYPDLVKGNEMTDRLFTHMHKEERNIAVMFMVDMSGSTRGWINDAEREALILMAESLQILGDRYAIYGFSGWARKRCEAYRIKDFNERLDEHVKRRICGIEPKDYTRMGAPIRHLVTKLHAVEARTKLLITLSDGKPDDYDPEYRGKYGIEDTRMALYEARREGVHSYCITIDREGKDYLPHMYGAANYTVIDRVEKLPLKISDIYRKLTS
ncbi:MAG: VWA domain-containing protein [Sedimenticolaceae bacterium]|nr:VWA domain-containing protein [Sedimenticolaceae bacterium]